MLLLNLARTVWTPCWMTLTLSYLQREHILIGIPNTYTRDINSGYALYILNKFEVLNRKTILIDKMIRWNTTADQHFFLPELESY